MSDQELTIGVVGDVRLNQPLALLRNPESARDLNDWIDETDIAIANLEMALTLRGHPADKLSVSRSDPELVNELVDCGFSVVTLANNHVTDYGIVGLEDTLSAVDKAGLYRVGAGRDWTEAVRPFKMSLPGGHTLHIVNFSCTLPPGSAAAPGRAGIAPLRVTQTHKVDPIFIQEQPGTSPWVETYVDAQDERAACEIIERARKEGGWILAVVHWGVPPHWHAPFQGDLATYQRPLARRLVAAGADAVVGHHPHVLHGIEIIDRSPVFYSLGNFIWHATNKMETASSEAPVTEPAYKLHWRQALSISAADPRKRESVFLQLHWQGKNWHANLVPVWLNANGEPELAEAERAEQILSRLQSMSRELGCTLEIEDLQSRAHVGG